MPPVLSPRSKPRVVLITRDQEVIRDLPPLRERRGDIPLLIDHFLRIYCTANGVPLKRVEPDVIDILEDYSWPGNVRELENLVQRLVLMCCAPVIKAKDVPPQILHASAARHEDLLIPERGIDFHDEMNRIEAAYVVAAVRRSGGKKMAAADLLRFSRQQMKYFCRKHKIA